MLRSECLECGKVYNEVENDKRLVEVTHGFCPECLKKIKERKKTKVNKKKVL